MTDTRSSSGSAALLAQLEAALRQIADLAPEERVIPLDQAFATVREMVSIARNELSALRPISGVAQAGPDPSLQKMQLSTRNAVIEECARVADQWGDGEATMAAAEIRMLKTSTVPSTDREDGK